jgi:hypothetical protein
MEEDRQLTRNEAIKLVEELQAYLKTLRDKPSK